ncbi:2-succinyl-6-hydroxy-2,4-cyclohexadiene-1-carboxylate synthase [Eubacterium plexicaudatum ASF492]|uniref:AB hydrolase-1 domain-containing protein n=1 Tax=Eubacterium plexicaudatum ASF492 TaxID=1235802 RepID=N2BGC7_9FIRM|nr:2-succinyl-6-hydroxy-2,4-cyclohexadiene-1-carboxylate synthase [Eubacterium plexicaudatum ASF492]
MYIHINRQILFYEKTGEGPPLLLLHGNGEDHTIFDALTPLLSQTYTVYAIDSRGHGASNPTEEYSYIDMAEDIAQLITSLEIHAPVLYGFSDGGIIGLLLALHHPGLISRLIISGANLNPRGMKLTFLHKVKQHYKKSGNPLERMMLEEPDIKPSALAQIRIPVLVLAGEYDIIKSAHTKLIAAKLPNAQLAIIPGEDHGSYIIHSDKLYPYIQDFME